MSAFVSTFGVDLNSSSYELHPSPKDSADTLQGNYCSNIRFSDTLSTEILDFVSNNECHYGMKIGTVQFMNDKRGKISFNVINESLSNCTLTVTKEANINTEIYETEYDRPPSNAMFLRRKGFVHSKLIIKHGLPSDSVKIRNPVTAKRATTTFKEVKGSQRLNMKQRLNNKRRLEHSYPPNKRLKSNVTLTQAIGEILFVQQATFDKIKRIISSRTSINVSSNTSNASTFPSILNKMADYYDKDKCYYLKKEYYNDVNWENSCVLTQSEKDQINNRANTTNTTNRTQTNRTKTKTKTKKDIIKDEEMKESEKFEMEYGVINNGSTYTKYDEIYQKKFSQRTTYLKSVNENSAYFKKMRALIKAENDPGKKQKMKQEFRQIFETRKQGIKDMNRIAEALRIELSVIKNRINNYVKEQQKLQQ